MENGHFQSSNMASTRELESAALEESPGVPIPSELPRTPDLSKLPGHILRSGAVEAVLQQNDDLMSRLSVGLRRIAILEEGLNTERQDNKKLQFKHQNLKDQVLLLEEKGKLLSERKHKAESRFTEMGEQIQMLEVQAAELYTSKKENQQTANSQIESLSQRIKRLLRYREQIRVAANSVRRKHQLEASQWASEKQMFLQEQERLRDKWLTDQDKFTTEAEVLQSSVEDLTTKLKESADYIQSQAQQASNDQAQLVENYESQLDSKNKNIESLTQTNSGLQQKTKQMDELYDRNVELENSVVFHQRRGYEQKQRFEKEIHGLQTSVSHYRSEAKSKSLENDHFTKELEEKNQALAELNEVRSNLDNQVESLQCLWKDNQRALEKQTQKVDSLQKLNQQLSTKLNEYRSDIRALKDKVDSVQIQASEKIKAIKASVEAQSAAPVIQPAKQTASTEGELADEASKPSNQNDPQLIDKIDSLIAEIESGFSKREP